jgi:hypothetical protein
MKFDGCRDKRNILCVSNFSIRFTDFRKIKVKIFPERLIFAYISELLQCVKERRGQTLGTACLKGVEKLWALRVEARTEFYSGHFEHLLKSTLSDMNQKLNFSGHMLIIWTFFLSLYTEFVPKFVRAF